MASENKTEEPTAKRLADARKQGQVARSNDLTGAAVLMAAVAMILNFAPMFFQTSRSTIHHSLTELLVKPVTEPQAIYELVISAVQQLVFLLWPLLAVLMLVAVGVNVAQVGFSFSPESIQPKFEKINPLSGIKRLFSMHAVVELGKGLLKIGVVGAISGLVIAQHQGELMALGTLHFEAAIARVVDVLQHIAWVSAIVFVVIGVADFVYQRYEFNKKMRMSKQEVIDEHKNAEGDPKIKQKIKEMGRQMLRKRQLQNVPKADVVITNPTHFSVAIQYDPDQRPAPMVVAKGVDHFALKIREVAKENGVPIIENKPLARALYSLVEVEHMIPPEMFVAVAEVLARVYKVNQRRRRVGRGG